MKINIANTFKMLGLTALMSLFVFGVFGFTSFTNAEFNTTLIGTPGSVLQSFYPGSGITVGGFLDLIIGIRNFIMFLAIVLGIIFLVLGGISYMRAGGDEAKMATARAQVIGGVIGLAIAVAAFVILNTIVQFAKEAGTGFSVLK